jgi:hypothetical protein
VTLRLVVEIEALSDFIASIGTLRLCYLSQKIVMHEHLKMMVAIYFDSYAIEIVRLIDLNDGYHLFCFVCN